MTDITELALLVSKAKASVFTLEYIAQFEPADIDSDDVDLRFEVDGRDTGTNVSIVDECMQAAKVISELVETLEKIQEENEELTRFKEIMASATEALKNGEPLNLESLFRGSLASAMLAIMFAGEFVRGKATNYLELFYRVPEFGEFTVTIQKVDGRTPAQRIADLEESHAQVIHARDHYKALWRESLKEPRTVTVKLPKRSVGEVMHMSGFSRDYAEGWCAGNDNAIHEMRAAGIKVETSQ